MDVEQTTRPSTDRQQSHDVHEQDEVLSRESPAQAHKQMSVFECLKAQLLECVRAPLLPTGTHSDTPIQSQQTKEPFSGVVYAATAARVVAVAFVLAGLFGTFLLLEPYLEMVPVEVFQAVLLFCAFCATVFAGSACEYLERCMR